VVLEICEERGEGAHPGLLLRGLEGDGRHLGGDLRIGVALHDPDALRDGIRLPGLFHFRFLDLLARLFRMRALRVALDVALVGGRRIGGLGHVPGGDVRGGRAPGEQEGEHCKKRFFHARGSI